MTIGASENWISGRMGEQRRPSLDVKYPSDNLVPMDLYMSLLEGWDPSTGLDGCYS